MKLLRDPLLHFVVAGGLLFGAYSWFGDREPPDAPLEPVRIDSGKVEWLKKTFTSQWLREPDREELEGLVGELVTEELLAREAAGNGPRPGRYDRAAPAGAKAEISGRGYRQRRRAAGCRSQEILRSQSRSVPRRRQGQLPAGLLQSGRPQGRRGRCGRHAPPAAGRTMPATWPKPATGFCSAASSRTSTSRRPAACSARNSRARSMRLPREAGPVRSSPATATT